MKRIFLISLVSIIFSCSPSDTEDDQKNAVPTAAILLSPVNDNICEEGINVTESHSDIEFQWEAGENSDLYELKITNLLTNAVFVQTVETTSTIQTLERGNPYSWIITSKSTENQFTEESPVWKFYLPSKGESSYAPFPAELVSPAFQAKVLPSSGKISLEWKGTDPDSNSLRYTVYLDTDREVVKLRESYPTKLSSSSLEVEVENGKRYYWLVETSDGKNVSFSDIFEFGTE